MPAARANSTKILLVLYYYYPYVSGVSVYAKRIAEGLVKQGYEVTVLTSQFEKKLKKNEVINGVRILRSPVLFSLGKGVIMPAFWLDIIRLSWNHDYINLHLPMADSGLSALFIPKRKLIVTYHCDLFLGNGLVNKLITGVSSALMHVQLRRAKVVVSNSEDYFAHSKMRHYLNKLTPIYPPFAVSDFTPLNPKPLYKRLGIPENSTNIGFVGRIVYEKGINYLLEAIPRLKKELPNLKVILVGDYKKVAGGSIKDELDQYIAKYPDTILFTGFLSDEDRNRFYSGLDVFVLPSIDPLESFGLVQVEALLCGSPVVGSDLPGVRQVAKVSGFGRIAKPKDPKDLARQILEVVKHPQKYKPERQQVIGHFSTPDAVKAYSNLMPKD